MMVWNKSWMMTCDLHILRQWCNGSQIRRYVFVLLTIDHKYRPRRGQRTEHHLFFYDNARADGLEEVNDCIDEFVQRFSDRSDFLHLRHVVFDGVDYDLSDQNPRRHVTVRSLFHRQLLIWRNQNIIFPGSASSAISREW